MAQVSMTPVRARDPRVDIEVLDGDFNALAVKEVTVTLANPAAGIEPVRRAAVQPATATGGSRACGFPSPGNGSCASTC